MRSIASISSIALAAAVLSACGPESARPETRRPASPNILLVTIDTFRADRLGRGVTPALDRLAAAGTRFTAARSTVPLTLPSHASILTGLLPPAHGVRENGVDRLADTHKTVAALLKNAGYRTAAFVGAFVLDRRFGLAQGFDTYDDQIPRDPNATDRLEAERPASAVIDRALAWLESRVPSPEPRVPSPESRAPNLESRAPNLESRAPNPEPPSRQPPAPSPFFVWIHLYDPHAPYTPPAEFARPSSYDGEVAYADAQIGRVFDWLRARALMDHTVVIVAGDHGEGLGDHGERTHGLLLYDSTLRVPLIVWTPGQPAAVRDDAVSLVEIAPTMLRAAGVPTPRDMGGADLYSETNYPRAAGWAALQALTDGRWKAIRAGRATEIYDIEKDPREEHDLAGTQPAIAAAMVKRIEVIRSGGGASAPRTISADAAERLRALGYVASSNQPREAVDATNPAARIQRWNTFETALTALNAHRPEAITMLATLTRDEPEALVFQATYARALRDAGRLTDALDVYRRQAQRHPTDATLLHDLAATARDAAARAAPTRGAAALRDESVKAERAAIALADSALAHNGLGLLLADDGHDAEAAREFDKAAALDPTNASYWTNAGNAKRAAGDRSGAEAAYRKAIEIGGLVADAANGLGVLLVESQRPAEAVPWFEQALAAAPDLVEARLNLGIARQQSGDPVRASEAYRAVLAARGGHAREKAAAAKLLAALGAPR